MAEVKVIPAVTEVIEIKAVPEKIIIECSREEAEVIRALTGLIYGLPPKMAELATSVWKSLEEKVALPDKYSHLIIGVVND